MDDEQRAARETDVRDLYRLWREGELEAALGRVHPEIVWAEPEETIGARRGTGVERARTGVTDWEGSFEHYSGELVSTEWLGDSLLVEFIQRIRAGGSTVDVESTIWHVWGFRDGLPARMEMFFERDQAVQAAKS